MRCSRTQNFLAPFLKFDDNAIPQRAHGAPRRCAVAELSLGCQAVMGVKHFQRLRDAASSRLIFNASLLQGATLDFAQKIFRFWNDLQERLAKDPGNACGAAISGNAATNFFQSPDRAR